LRTGFTLIEVAVSTVLLGLGVAALLMATGASTEVDGQGRQLSQGLFLAEQLHEYCLKVDNIDNLANVSFSPPIDGTGAQVSPMSDWTQEMSVAYIDPDNLSAAPVFDASQPGYIPYSDARYVRCRILFKGQPVVTTEWIMMRK